NVENASSVVETVRSMLSTETAMDFNFEMGADFFDPNAHSQSALEKKSTGYPYMDTCLKGGWWKGALFAFIAGPKCGKSMWLSNMAAQSMKEGDNVAYITLELPVPIVMSRIGANLLNVSSDDYESFSKDTSLLTKKLREFKTSQLKPLGKLHVKQFPTSSASTTDIAMYLKKVEELQGYKFDRIYIDYINLIKNWRNPNSENLYMKIKQIAEDLRAESIINNWTIITVTQSKISNWGGTDMTIGDVSESSGLIHTVDGCFGIITNPEMKAMGEYYLKYMASRIGGFENTRKKYNILWNYCRITEDLFTQIEDMEMITQLNKNNQRSQNIDASINNTQISHKNTGTTIITNNITSSPTESITGFGLF
ncbi:MAG: DnaB-like helicase C-terminal domain-containing protein, partial [Clostridia bacterium]